MLLQAIEVTRTVIFKRIYGYFQTLSYYTYTSHKNTKRIAKSAYRGIFYSTLLL